MDLHAVKISSSFKDMQSLEKLNQEAFPQAERVAVERLVRLADEKKIEFSAIYDRDTFVGFYALRIHAATVYLLFLAIAPSKRSQGYGGEALSLLAELYRDYQIVLELEKLDEHAENWEQRRARKQFYLRNGYYETGYLMTYNELVFEVVCNQQDFDEVSFFALLEKMKSRRFQPRLYQE